MAQAAEKCHGRPKIKRCVAALFSLVNSLVKRKKFPEIMYFRFSAYDFTCEIIEVNSTNTCRRGIDYIVFAKFLARNFLQFAAQANRVSSGTSEIYNLLSISTRYLSLPHACMSPFVLLELS